MSNQTEWQKWCAETAPVMAAAGRGEKIELLSSKGIWQDKISSSGFYLKTKYRIKPRTIRIGDYDVPEPMRRMDEAKVVGNSHIEFYRVVLTTDKYGMAEKETLPIGYPHSFDFECGIYHASREAAIGHAMALMSLTAKKD